MNMPGFTAETSLYQTSNQYRLNGTLAQVDKSIQLAAFRNSCYWDCLANCNDLDFFCSVNCNCFCKGGPPVCQYQ